MSGLQCLSAIAVFVTSTLFGAGDWRTTNGLQCLSAIAVFVTYLRHAFEDNYDAVFSAFRLLRYLLPLKS